jgi:hypothetical protein
MIYQIITLITLLPTIVFPTNFGSNSTKDLKQPVNFNGKITTHQGQEFIVDNISINNKIAKISMPLKPENLPQSELNADTKKYEVKLPDNPNDIAKKEIELDDTSEIRTFAPDTIYVYQKKERSQRLEFIALEQITKSGNKYLLLAESRTPIYCDVIDNAGPQETTIPLSALKTMTIAGFKCRTTSTDKKKECKTNAPCEK